MYRFSEAFFRRCQHHVELAGALHYTIRPLRAQGQNINYPPQKTTLAASSRHHVHFYAKGESKSKVRAISTHTTGTSRGRITSATARRCILRINPIVLAGYHKFHIRPSRRCSAGTRFGVPIERIRVEGIHAGAGYSQGGLGCVSSVAGSSRGSLPCAGTIRGIRFDDLNM